MQAQGQEQGQAQEQETSKSVKIHTMSQKTTSTNAKSPKPPIFKGTAILPVPFHSYADRYQISRFMHRGPTASMTGIQTEAFGTSSYQIANCS